MKRVVVLAVMGGLAFAEVASAQTVPSGAVSSGPFTMSAEALVWWFKGSAAPTPLAIDNLDINAKPILGGRDLDTNPNPGFRLTAAYELTERWGVGGSFFYVPRRSTVRSVASSGQPGSRNLYIPFFDVTEGAEFVSTYASSADGVAGNLQEELCTSLLGGELNGTMRMTVAGPWRVDLLGGFRHLQLRETYTFVAEAVELSPTPANNVFRNRDQFDATNNFYGAQVGVRTRVDWGAWYASSVAKVAFGSMVQTVDIEGSTVTNFFNDFGAPQTYPGGFFALPTNMGSRTRSVFGVVPEAGLTVGYQLTPWVSVVAGYTFVYANSVVRAPLLVNRKINPNGINATPQEPRTGPDEPSLRFKTADFWAQGLNVGLVFRF